MTQPAVNPCSVSIASNDYRYYVKDISILDSVIAPPSSDVRYKVIPAYLKLWDSVANYRSAFESMAVSPLINPVVFNPDPYHGDYQNLWKLERFADWSASTVYDSSNSMTFPNGMLKPAMPVVQYNVNPYQPPLELEIPVIPVPQERTPSLTLPDIIIPSSPDPTPTPSGGVMNLSVVCNICYLSASVSFSQDSKSAAIIINWAVPPPVSGMWVPVVVSGQCMWNTVNVCSN